MKFPKLRNVRKIFQGLFLLVFLVLFILTESKGDDTLSYPVRLFLDFDPLLALSTFLAAHTVSTAMFLSIVVLLVTLVAGRVFCGWVCPLGTLNTIFGSLKRRPEEKSIKPPWRHTKYYLLIFLMVSALFGLQLAGLFDPLSLTVRSLTLSAFPAFNFLTRSFFDALYYTDIPAITRVSEPIYSALKNSVLSFQQPYFKQALFTGLLFMGILMLNFRAKRFWCRYLCPLGALLGLCSRYALLSRSVAEGCNECGLCAGDCEGGANPEKKDGWLKTECLYCGNCDDDCPRHTVSFGFRKSLSDPAPLQEDLGRRNVIASILSAVAVIPLFRVAPLSRKSYSNQDLIRPPGALPEKDFLRRCVKCGECMRVCITNGLQPTLFDAGLEGLWTPKLVPRLGYCEYHCTLCGQVCPTGAVRRLSAEEKMKEKIGLAIIDRNRCLPYAEGEPCIVCEEVCPIASKAIRLEQVNVTDRKGRRNIVKQPHVDSRLCTGCGICENKCPVEGRSAISVRRIQSRS